MHEPSLFELANRDPTAESYRLLWLRDQDRPASIRLAIKPNGRGWFYRRTTGGTGSTRPTGVHEIGMSWSWKSRTASFLKTIEDAGFWSQPDQHPDSSQACRSHWILEGVRAGQYRVIDRCSPEPGDPSALSAFEQCAWPTYGFTAGRSTEVVQLSRSGTRRQ